MSLIYPISAAKFVSLLHSELLRTPKAKSDAGDGRTDGGASGGAITAKAARGMSGELGRGGRREERGKGGVKDGRAPNERVEEKALHTSEGPKQMETSRVKRRSFHHHFISIQIKGLHDFFLE